MSIEKSSFWRDLLERSIATAIQAGLALMVTTVSDIEHLWAIPIATALAALKAEVKRWIERKELPSE